MVTVIVNILVVGGSVFLGLIISNYTLKNKKFLDIEKDEKTARGLINQSNKEAKEINERTIRDVQKRKESLAQESFIKKERFKKINESLINKEEFIEKKEDRLKELRFKIASLQEETQSTEQLIKRSDEDYINKLSKKTGKSTAQLKEDLLKKHEKDVLNENVEKLIKTEEGLKEDAEKTARKIIINVLQRLSSPTSVETRAVTVVIQKDHIKGKIVGKDGRNIQAFEELLDVDVVFNDLPNTISISAFMLVKRRIAQRAMEKLVNIKGNIDEGVVKRVVKEAEKETDDELYEIGLSALKKMGIKHDNHEFCRVVGRLQYRTSYGQNIMKHSMEVGWIAAMIGGELGLNIETCKVAGFLHDLGKAIDQDPSVKDAHDYLSKELMEKFEFSPEEVHAAWTHHDAIPQETAEALIVKAADAVSASRPGARQESFDKYIERIRALEETALSYEGVKRAYSISAGRELRVMVDPETVGDEKLFEIAKAMAGQIEEELAYPGQIKVNVIRRTKHTETAK